jgi:hypothetical protein
VRAALFAGDPSDTLQLLDLMSSKQVESILKNSFVDLSIIDSKFSDLLEDWEKADALWHDVNELHDNMRSLNLKPSNMRLIDALVRSSLGKRKKDTDKQQRLSLGVVLFVTACFTVSSEVQSVAFFSLLFFS